jgi:hypothetical protein
MACFNVSFLVIGILTFLSDTSQYGIAIESETAEWSKNTIVDMAFVNVNQECPSEHEKLTGIFPGLNAMCISDEKYEVGAC